MTKAPRYRYVCEVVVETDKPVSKKAVREWVQYRLDFLNKTTWVGGKVTVFSARVRRNVDVE